MYLSDLLPYSDGVDETLAVTLTLPPPQLPLESSAPTPPRILSLIER